MSSPSRQVASQTKSNRRSAHNKKRNVGIIYEQLVRYISSAVVRNDRDTARKVLAIVREHFRPGTCLHREFRLFNALTKTSVPSEALAIRVLDEARAAASQHDPSALDREKSLLIRSINHGLDDSGFFGQRIPEYRAMATVQVLLNEWRRPSEERDVSLSSEYERKVIEMLREEKQQPSLDRVDNVNPLALGLMSKKVAKRVSESGDRTTIRLVMSAARGDGASVAVEQAAIKSQAEAALRKFSGSNSNAVLAERLDSVRQRVSLLDPGDSSDESVSRFMLVHEMVNEIVSCEERE